MSAVKRIFPGVPRCDPLSAIAGALHHTCPKAGEKRNSMKCPNCSSERIVVREAGKKAGGAVGAVAGATAGAISVARGAQVGATLGLMAGPVGAAAGGLAGAAAAILFGGSAGAAIGGAMGSVADESFLDNRRCLACDTTFREEGGDDAPPLGDQTSH